MNWKTRLCILLLAWAVVGATSLRWQVQMCGVLLALIAASIAFFAKEK